MKKANIIVMGKTGAGKSTIINSVLGEELAPTGVGESVTKTNEMYSKQILLPVGNQNDEQYGMVGYNLNMYDTVGLEIDRNITESTLEKIKQHIEEAKNKMSDEDVHLVWFCVNYRNSRFEKYELELIRNLSIDYEIPFVIVLTKCLSNVACELEEQVRVNLPEISTTRVLAKDYPMRGGSVIPAYGLDDLIRLSINEYKSLKVEVIEQKLLVLDEERIERISCIEKKGKNIVEKYISSATKIGFIPGGCIPIVHGMCIKMIADLNKLAGIKSGSDFAGEIFNDVVIGLIATPFMIVPLLSAAVASAYVETTGNDYLKALMNVIYLSTDKELMNNAILKQRLKEQLKKMK